jgi:hypothetical protein
MSQTSSLLYDFVEPCLVKPLYIRMLSTLTHTCKGWSFINTLPYKTCSLSLTDKRGQIKAGVNTLEAIFLIAGNFCE